jgi:hypothetical protein
VFGGYVSKTTKDKMILVSLRRKETTKHGILVENELP